LPELQAELSRVADGLTGALEELQEISRGIHPAILARGGLAAALKILARRSAVPVELDVRAGARLPEPVEVAAYYIVSEALTNTAKHAHASAVHVAVEAHDGVLALSIRDDGRGGADPARGSGLIGLTDRSGEPRRSGNDAADQASHRRGLIERSPSLQSPLRASCGHALEPHRRDDVRIAGRRAAASQVPSHPGTITRNSRRWNRGPAGRVEVTGAERRRRTQIWSERCRTARGWADRRWAALSWPSFSRRAAAAQLRK
jgi:hypothetical protein